MKYRVVSSQVFEVVPKLLKHFLVVLTTIHKRAMASQHKIRVSLKNGFHPAGHTDDWVISYFFAFPLLPTRYRHLFADDDFPGWNFDWKRFATPMNIPVKVPGGIGPLSATTSSFVPSELVDLWVLYSYRVKISNFFFVTGPQKANGGINIILKYQS